MMGNDIRKATPETLAILLNKEAIAVNQDPLGRQEVRGKLRFLPELVELHWQVKGNVFRGGAGGMETVELPYRQIESVEVVKRWWRMRQLVLRVDDFIHDEFNSTRPKH